MNKSFCKKTSMKTKLENRAKLIAIMKKHALMSCHIMAG